MKPCPFCAEPIEQAAIICPHCGSAVPGGDAATGQRPGKGKPNIWLVVICVVVGLPLLAGCCGLSGLWLLGSGLNSTFEEIERGQGVSGAHPS